MSFCCTEKAVTECTLKLCACLSVCVTSTWKNNSIMLVCLCRTVFDKCQQVLKF